jgi:hypothetical protein
MNRANPAHKDGNRTKAWLSKWSSVVLANANRQLRLLARRLVFWSRRIPASDCTKRSSEPIAADGRKISGADLLWLYKQDLIVILDYPVSTTLDAGITRPEEILSELLSKGDRGYEDFLRHSAKCVEVFGKVEHTAKPDGTTPYWDNGWLPTLDAISLMTILSTNPTRYIEVGSGNSTKFARHVISELGLRTKIISIDPHPRAEIDALCDEVVRSKLEYCDSSVFTNMGDGDVFFLDGSHRAFQNSDVAQFFANILPQMQPGCTYGIHDIFTPKDYPENFRNRYYNEQYLFEAYLLGGAAGDTVLFPCAYVAYNSGKFRHALDTVWGVASLKSMAPWGGAIWMRRGPHAQAGERSAKG